MLGTLAGISITFISMRPAAQMWEVPWIALPRARDHPHRLDRQHPAAGRLPGRARRGDRRLGDRAGSAATWSIDAGQRRRPSRSRSACRRCTFDLLFDGLEGIAPLLATAIPLGIYNFTEAMNNVESASAAGDNYNLRNVLLADGIGAIVGSVLGSPFPPAVYIGHPGWKAVGGRIGYSLATGVADLRCSASSGCSRCSARSCRSRRSCRSCSTSAS